MLFDMVNNLFLCHSKLMDCNCCIGSVAERSKALVLGTSLFGGVGSNPTAATGFGTENHRSMAVP